MKRHNLLMIGLVAGLLWFGAGAAWAAPSAACPTPFDDAGTECTLSAGLHPFTGIITFTKTVHFLANSHLDATGPPFGVGITLNVNGAPGLNFIMEANSIDEANDPPAFPNLNASAGPITIDVSGNFLMQSGSSISAENDASGGSGGEIKITVHGDSMTLCGTTHTTAGLAAGCVGNTAPGATISSQKTVAGGGGQAGNITLAVGSTPPAIPFSGVFTMEPGSVVTANSALSAGDIKITSGKSMDINGSVLSESTNPLFGVPNQPRGGATITLKGGCALTVTDGGKVSSKGADPGADLVHLEACDVVIYGLVQSTTTAGHAVPVNPDPNHCNLDTAAHPLGGAANFTACVEIWAENITIDNTGTHNGEVNADGVRAPNRAWIDLFAFKNISTNGDTDNYLIHANGEASTNTFGGVITVKAKTGKVETLGLGTLAIQANANAPTSAGGNGGAVIIEAGGAGSPVGDVDLGTATIQAIGHTGNVSDTGGSIAVRSFQGNITGSAPGSLDAHGDGGANPGIITLTACLTDPAVTYIAAGGTTNPAAGTFVVCPGPTMPTFPANVGGPGATFFFDTAHIQFWAACEFGPGGRKSGVKFNDLNNNGVKDPGEPVLNGWMIHVINSSGVDALAPQATGFSGPGQYTFIGLPAGTYTVCEELKTGWTQTFPTVVPPPPGETLATNCAGLGTGLGLVFGPNGYNFTISTGNENLQNNDFGNHENPTCKEDPNRANLLTRIVNPSKPLGGGGVPGNPKNYDKIQKAYNDAIASAISEVIGLSSNTNENLVLGGTKSLIITQCDSAKVTAADSNQPVWNITSTGKLTIISPDSYGGTIGWRIQTNYHDIKSIRAYGASQYGVQIIGNSNSVSFNAVSGNKIEGVRIEGDSNTIKSGTISGNGIGVHLTSTANGNNVSGGTVQGNTGDGIFVEGSGNTLDSEKVYSNGGHGVHTTSTASSTTLKSVSSGNPENTGAEFLLGVAATNGGGNKADGTSIPKTNSPTKCPTFPAAGTCE